MFTNVQRWGLALLLAVGLFSSVQADTTQEETVQNLVASVVNYYKNHGAQATFDRLNGGWTFSGEFYVFVNQVSNKKIVAHASNPSLVGKSASEHINSEGRYVVQEINDTATESGAWINYKWVNPATGQDSNKRSWVIRIDDYVIGAGYYTTN